MSIEDERGFILMTKAIDGYTAMDCPVDDKKIKSQTGLLLGLTLKESEELNFWNPHVNFVMKRIKIKSPYGQPIGAICISGCQNKGVNEYCAMYAVLKCFEVLRIEPMVHGCATIKHSDPGFNEILEKLQNAQNKGFGGYGKFFI